MTVSLADRLDKAYSARQPFLIYSLPNASEIIASFDLGQVNPGIGDKNGVYFTIVSFLSDIKLKFELGELDRYDLPDDQQQLSWIPNIEIGKDHHKRIVSDAVQSIEDGAFDKVVLGRSAELTLKEFNPGSLMNRLFSSNRGAMRYIWFHPDHGIWAGATPEVLLETSGRYLETMSLAGTRLKRELDNNPFSQKEMEEQAYVTRMIAETLKDKTSELQVGEAGTHQAGKLVHIITQIKGHLLPGISPYHVAEALHPTPAVCGVPKNEAMDFIRKNEGYDREFYSGYLGIIDRKNELSKYFVNLRCMKIVNEEATLYAGGGITSLSDPESEWQETQNKLRTMGEVLAPFL